jgi:hypothetical protein
VGDLALNPFPVHVANFDLFCLAISLAYTGLRIVLATINRRLNFELFQTTAEDVVLQHDLVTANAKLDCKRKVRFKGRQGAYQLEFITI